MKYFIYIFIFWFTQNVVSQAFQSIKIDTILNEKISIRAIIIDKEKIWYAGNESRFGFYNYITDEKKEIQLKDDILKLEFRCIAQNSKFIFIANIGSPAFIFKINKSDFSFEKVYAENHENAFYDSMNFWNEQEGIAIGDPTEDCLSVLITRDGGKTWKKSICETLPKVVKGEVAFAASNTNICINGTKTWIVTGGIKSRVFYSDDKAKSWQVYETPMAQGESMTGIFTTNFYNNKIGIIAGGNYEKPTQNSQNKAITADGGKTWKLIAENSGFGYTSCVQFVPNSKGKKMVLVGASGIYYSKNKGVTWKQLSSDNSLYTIRFIDKNIAIAAGRDKIIRITFL